MANFDVMMDIDARHMRVIEGRLEVSQIRGELGYCGPLLRLPASLRPTVGKYGEVKLLSGTGYLFYGTENYSNTAKPWVSKERISTSEPLYAPDSRNWNLVFPFTWETIEKIEKTRNGSNFFLTFAIDGLFEDSEGLQRMLAQAQASCYFEMNRADWQDKVLDGWEYTAHHFTCWSAPREQNEALADAMAEYKKAERYFRSSDWEQTLVSLRNAYERLVSLRKWDLEGEGHFNNRLDAMKKQLLKGLIGSSRADMVVDLIKSQRVVLSTPAKPGGRDVDRNTASLALKVAGTVLEYVSDALRDG